MRIKMIIDIGNMSDKCKDTTFRNLELLAGREIFYMPFAVQCNNIFDWRMIGKNHYLIFGEIEDKDILRAFCVIVSYARLGGARFDYLRGASAFADLMGKVNKELDKYDFEEPSDEDEDEEFDEEKYKAFMRKMRRIMKD